MLVGDGMRPLRLAAACVLPTRTKGKELVSPCPPGRPQDSHHLKLPQGGRGLRASAALSLLCISLGFG